MAAFHKANEDYVTCILQLFACKKSVPSTGGHVDDDNVPPNPSVPQDTAATRMLSKSLARGLGSSLAVAVGFDTTALLNVSELASTPSEVDCRCFKVRIIASNLRSCCVESQTHQKEVLVVATT